MGWKKPVSKYYVEEWWNCNLVQVEHKTANGRNEQKILKITPVWI